MSRVSAPPAPAPALSWTFSREGATTVVELSGEIDEHAELGPLGARLTPAVVLDLSRIRRINSQGVRAWIDFLHQLPAVRELTFRRCSPAVITQVNMIANFRGLAAIESFYAPYVCDSCGHELEHLIEVADQRRRGNAVPAVACPKCRAAMSFDDVAERYLSFLTD